jgi:hypothetical protein
MSGFMEQQWLLPSSPLLTEMASSRDGWQGESKVVFRKPGGLTAAPLTYYFFLLLQEKSDGVNVYLRNLLSGIERQVIDGFLASGVYRV